jgi:hypothetical protein
VYKTKQVFDTCQVDPKKWFKCQKQCVTTKTTKCHKQNTQVSWTRKTSSVNKNRQVPQTLETLILLFYFGPDEMTPNTNYKMWQTC